jgi:hypothetical protein
MATTFMSLVVKMNVSNEYRKTIEELLALYKLEKDIKDLYVEGESDKHFLEWHLGQIGIAQPDIYTIETIYIPSEYLFEKGYEDNNRDRILYLISILNDGKNFGKYKGIIDQDILYFTREFPFEDNILTTDYACFEMYAYNVDVMTKINDVGFSHKINDNLIPFIDKMLKFSSSIRIFEKRKGISIKKLEYDRYIEYKNKSFEFNEKKFLAAFYNSRGIGVPYDKFLIMLSAISDELSEKDVREYSNGHDFIAILRCTLKESKVINSHITDNVVRAMIMVAVDTKYLMTYNLFQALTQFYEK